MATATRTSGRSAAQKRKNLAEFGSDDEIPIAKPAKKKAKANEAATRPSKKSKNKGTRGERAGEEVAEPAIEEETAIDASALFANDDRTQIVENLEHFIKYASAAATSQEKDPVKLREIFDKVKRDAKRINAWANESSEVIDAAMAGTEVEKEVVKKTSKTVKIVPAKKTTASPKKKATAKAKSLKAVEESTSGSEGT